MASIIAHRDELRVALTRTGARQQLVKACRNPGAKRRAISVFRILFERVGAPGQLLNQLEFRPRNRGARTVGHKGRAVTLAHSEAFGRPLRLEFIHGRRLRQRFRTRSIGPHGVKIEAFGSATIRGEGEQRSIRSPRGLPVVAARRGRKSANIRE